MNIYDVMKEKNIVLHNPIVPIGIYTKAELFGGNLIYSSGISPTRNEEHVYTGKVGKEVTLEQAQEAARFCMLNILANIEEKIGDLNKIKRVVKVLGFVASAEGFYDHPAVINGASSLLIDIFGEENGKGARAAVGVYSLPCNIPVEVEAIFELKD